MLCATLIGIFLIPVFYVVMQRISERHAPFRPEDAAARKGGATTAGSLPGTGHV